MLSAPLKYSTENNHPLLLSHSVHSKLPFSLSSLFTNRKWKVKAALHGIFQKRAQGNELKPEQAVFGQSNEVKFQCKTWCGQQSL